MACFDLQHPVQPLFVDSSLAASRYSIAATQVLCCTPCVHKSRPMLSLWKSSFGHYKDFLFFVIEGLTDLSALWCITEACFEVGFSQTALIGWCGRLSVHDSSFSLHGPTLRLVLPDGDSPHSYWHFDPMHNPEILVHITYACTLGSFHWTCFWFFNCISCEGGPT